MLVSGILEEDTQVVLTWNWGVHYSPHIYSYYPAYHLVQIHLWVYQILIHLWGKHSITILFTTHVHEVITIDVFVTSKSDFIPLWISEKICDNRFEIWMAKSLLSQLFWEGFSGSRRLYRQHVVSVEFADNRCLQV